MHNMLPVLMVRNIDHCMTDRAIVNSATVNLLAKTLNKPLTKLFCHIHLLEATTRKWFATGTVCQVERQPSTSEATQYASLGLEYQG